jgi:hypothetical protein
VATRLRSRVTAVLVVLGSALATVVVAVLPLTATEPGLRFPNYRYMAGEAA